MEPELERTGFCQANGVHCFLAPLANDDRALTLRHDSQLPNHAIRYHSGIIQVRHLIFSSYFTALRTINAETFNRLEKRHIKWGVNREKVVAGRESANKKASVIFL